MIRTLIVDDERLARLKLKKMLEDISFCELIGEAESVDQAIEKINNLKPELLLLDIQMPGKSGFDLLDEINFNGEIIFITAFDSYAIKAFEVNALDYLLKPVSQERLEQAILKYHDSTNAVHKSQSKLSFDDLLFLLIGQGMRFLKVRDIVCIRGAVDYTNVYTVDGQHGLVLKTLREWEERLPENVFCRIHRSSIINITFVLKLDKWFNQSYRVYLKGIDESLTMSKRHVKKLKEKLG